MTNEGGPADFNEIDTAAEVTGADETAAADDASESADSDGE